MINYMVTMLEQNWRSHQLCIMIVGFGLRRKRWRCSVYILQHQHQLLLLWIWIWSGNLLKEILLLVADELD